MVEPVQHKEIGNRLVQVRMAFSGLSQKEWAEKHGFKRTQLNNWERGVRRVPIEVSITLSQLYGLSLDWIYLDRRDALSSYASAAIFGKK